MWALLRATHFGPSIAVTLFASVLAWGAGRGAETLLVAASVLAGQFSIGWANDWLDAARDRRVGRRDKPIVAGTVGVSTVRRAALGAAAACVPLSFASGLAAGAAHVSAVALGWSYDAGLKSTSLSALPFAGAFGLLPVYVALGAPGGGTGPWWAAIGGALLGAGAHFTNVLPDLADDAATGVRGLPQRLGPKGSVAAAAALLAAGVLVVCLAPAGRVDSVRLASLIAGLACVAGAAGAGAAERPRLAFPAAIAAVAAVMAGFATVGEQLS